jgi:hypothetical protein
MLSEDEAEYSRLWETAAVAADLGRVRAGLVGSRMAAVRAALLATAPAVDRRASILRLWEEWRVSSQVVKARPPAPREHRVNSRVSQARTRCYLMRKAGDRGR